MKCCIRVRRNIRFERPAVFLYYLGLALCPEHEVNERELRSIGYDSRDEEAVPKRREQEIHRGWGRP